jgi:hypothetical protein
VSNREELCQSLRDEIIQLANGTGSREGHEIHKNIIREPKAWIEQLS